MAAKKRKSREPFGRPEPLPSGRWRARYTGPDGKRYSAPRTFDNITQARAWLAAKQTELATLGDEWVPPAVVAARKAEKQVSLGDYSQKWLKTRTNARGDHLRPRTVEEYERLLRAPKADDPEDTGGPLAELLPLLLGALTTTKIRDWRAAQLATGKKTQTSRAYGLLNAIMATAVEDGIITANPCTIKGGQSTHTGRAVMPPTDDQLETILATIKPVYKSLVLVASEGGLRFGEATALRAKDVTIERNPETREVEAVRIRVERGAARTAEGIKAGQPKSAAGVREVAIFGNDAVTIAEHVHGKIGDALLWPAADGVSFLAQSAFWRHWNAARTAAGRADMPFHALRHYAGTRYAQTGATPRETMARLGHSSMGAAIRYQHSGTRDDELARRMARRRA